MNDLISRKALLRALSNWDISRLYLVESFKELIKEQPTAYDVKSVVEQLEYYAKESHIIYIREDEECCRGWYEALEFAIEIVERGGIDED